MSFEMADNHLTFLVTIPIHDGNNESSGTSMQLGTSEKQIEYRLPTSGGNGSEFFLQKVEKSALRFDYSEIKILRPQIREI